MTRAAMPSVQAEAETKSAVDLTSPSSQRPAESLSSISRSAVAASGTRRSASASTISASPSLVESENACRKSSTPPKPPSLPRIASIRRRARASIRRSAAPLRGTSAKNLAASSSSAGAYGAWNGGRAAVTSSMPVFYRVRDKAGWGRSISFWRLAPFPFAALPVVASDAALDHFVAPFVAGHDERGEIAAAKTKPAKGNHDDHL